MTVRVAAEAIAPEEAEYRRRTPASAAFFAAASEHLPGGDSRSTLFYPPYPAVYVRGAGAWITDLDGNELLDFTANHSSLVHGYGHPRVVEAAKRQLELGTAFPGASPPQLRLARLLTTRVSSMERVRFTNSGTEATLNVLRAARAFTGRRKIGWATYGYHGTVDETMTPSHPDTLRLTFNDPDGAEGAIRAAAGALAAVLVEPLQASAGMIPARRDYLERLREVTRRYGILLVFDEVVSFRLAWGGAQEHFGVAPDLTILGKLIGGGFPLGAFGGRADVMALFDPTHGPPRVPHPGSYNANPMSLAAGSATLELLTRDEIGRINQMGDRLRAGVAQVLREAGLPARVTGMGSLFGIHPDGPDGAECRRRLFLGLYNVGILIDPRGVGSVSTVHTAADVTRLLSGLRRVAARCAATVSPSPSPA
jgi:glutamate-1-semialdehyde 2,1-aminomutase